LPRLLRGARLAVCAYGARRTEKRREGTMYIGGGVIALILVILLLIWLF
jgi:hypothetical protein